MMRRFFPGILVAVIILGFPAGVFGDPMARLLERFSSVYDGLEPPPNSSVHGDFKRERIMVSTAYTVEALKLLHDQNTRLAEKYDLMLEKYDGIMEQNREMIELLKRIAEKEKDKE